MFWGKKKAEDDKEKQLKQLKNAFPSLRRPQNDDTLFEIRFTVDNQSNALRIFIPADFPTMRPVLQVAGPVTHPWLDQFKQVNGCQRLLNWNKSSVLVEIVEEALSTLMNGGVMPSSGAATQPPTPLPQAFPPNSSAGARQSLSGPVMAGMAGPQDPRASFGAFQPMDNRASFNGAGGVTYGEATHQQLGYAHPPSASSGTRASFGGIPESKPSASPLMTDPGRMGGSTVDLGPRSPLAMPEIPSTFPELERMTDAQLERLVKDEVALMAHVEKNVSSIEMMRAMILDLQRSNAEVASSNVLQNEDIQALKERALGLQGELRVAANAYAKEYDGLMQRVACKPDIVMQQLNAERQKLDEASEEIGKKLVNGDLELSTFLKDYLETRTKYNVLSTKAQLVRL